MTTVITQFGAQHGVSRREFLKTGGALVVSFAASGCALQGARPAALLPQPGAVWPDKIAADALDSWVRIAANGNVTASVGKIEAGMGIGTAFTQIVAEELDVPLSAVEIRMGDTASTVDQRGTGSSNGISQGGSALRNAAAEARRALLAMAAVKLNVASDKLQVENGIVWVRGEASRRVSYGELIGGKQFNLKLAEKPATKNPKDYKIVGKSIARMDIPQKVVGGYPYLVDLNVPGMVHARMVSPPEAHAKVVALDLTQKFPGLVRIVHDREFVGVICEREEQAINAARDLKITWSKPAPLYSANYDALYKKLRTDKPKVSKAGQNIGDVSKASVGAAKRIEGHFEYPFQSHASMGPACAIADVKGDAAIVWMGGQKPYPLRAALGLLLNIPREKIRVIWQPGPGSYGMNDADDCAGDAALLSQACGRPVRLQYTRAQGTGWDAKGPPIAFNLAAALDEKGDILACDYTAYGYSGRIRPSGTDVAGDFLAGQLRGHKAASTDLHQYPAESYKFPSKRTTSHIIPWEQSLATPLRTAHLRDPDGMATCFASESFVDEMALAAGLDPVAFRLKYLTEKRDLAVVKAAADKANWQTRIGPNPNNGGQFAIGRGIAYAPRNNAVVAIVAEVSVNKTTGKFRVTRFVCAHDCGLIINPSLLNGTIEANLIQGMSRAMYEEVRFDSSRVLSLDWNSYPIGDITDTPDAIEIVHLNNRPDATSRGAGEPSTRPMAAAIGNALFDALGVRIRRVPFSPAQILAALKTA